MSVAAQPKAPGASRRLLILRNPGRVSHYYMEGIVRGAQQLGIDGLVLDAADLWRGKQVDQAALTSMPPFEDAAVDTLEKDIRRLIAPPGGGRRMLDAEGGVARAIRPDP